MLAGLTPDETREPLAVVKRAQTGFSPLPVDSPTLGACMEIAID